MKNHFLIILISVLHWSLFSGLTHATALELNGSDPVRELGSIASALADSSATMTFNDARRALVAGKFEPVSDRHFDAGYSTTTFWIAIPLNHVGSREATYLLSSNIPYVPELSVSLLRHGVDAATAEPETLLEKTEATPWRDDQFMGQFVVSEQFQLNPGESATLLIRFQPYGIGILPLSIETPESIIKSVARANRTLLIFYSFALTSFALFLIFVLAMRQAGGLYFVVMFCFRLLMMLQIDGLLNQWVWPEWPGWNKVASFPLLLALCSAMFATATFMLRTGDQPRFARASRALAFGCFLPLVLLPVVEVAWLILIGFVFMVSAMGLLTYAVINWARFLRGKAFISSAIAVVIFTGVSFFLIDVLSGEANLSPQNLTNVKILHVLMTLIIVLSYATQVAAMNRDFSVSVKRELELARNEARISAELLESERRYAHAQNLVARQSNRLANASHDLRQPIASLRLTLDAITRKADGSVDEDVVRAFDYLDELVSDHLVETNEEQQLITRQESEVETVAAALITRTVVEMFAEEAAAKGLRLKHVESSATMVAAPMPVMRIISNLVSNAVKYTDAGGVLIGSRRRGKNVAFEVFDTGPGLSEAELQRLSARYEKGETSAGEGLGLAICHELAALHDFHIAVKSVRGRGTRFSLLIPMAADIND